MQRTCMAARSQSVEIPGNPARHPSPCLPVFPACRLQVRSVTATGSTMGHRVAREGCRCSGGRGGSGTRRCGEEAGKPRAGKDLRRRRERPCGWQSRWGLVAGANREVGTSGGLIRQPTICYVADRTGATGAGRSTMTRFETGTLAPPPRRRVGTIWWRVDRRSASLLIASASAGPPVELGSEVAKDGQPVFLAPYALISETDC